MAVIKQKTSYSGRVPEIWRGECKILPGGYGLNNELPVGTIVRRGTPVRIYNGFKADLCKTATVLSGGTTTSPRIGKGNLFQVGDVVFKVGSDGTVSRSITSIDRSNADYDVLTFGSALTGLVADDAIVEATPYGYYDAESTDVGALKVVASGASDGQVNLATAKANYNGSKDLAANDYVILKNADTKFQPNAVVGADLEIKEVGVPTLAVAYEALVLYPSLQFPVLAEWLNDGGICMKENPNILFIKQ